MLINRVQDLEKEISIIKCYSPPHRTTVTPITISLLLMFLCQRDFQGEKGEKRAWYNLQNISFGGGIFFSSLGRALTWKKIIKKNLFTWFWYATGPRSVRNYCSAIYAWIRSNYKVAHREITLLWSFSIPNKLAFTECLYPRLQLCILCLVCFFCLFVFDYIDIVSPEIDYVPLPKLVVRNIKIKSAANF